MIDLTGQKFGKLTVVKEAGLDSNGRLTWVCECSCGIMRVIKSSNLKRGNTKSCGCLQKEIKITHGQYRTPTYNSWGMMKQRCNDTNYTQYKNYGGRGIEVCKRWGKFENFLDDMGKRPEGKTIDRINNDGNYTPKNCRWATPHQQMHNQQKSKLT